MRIDVDAEGRRIAVHPASNGQQRMWFLQQCLPDSPVYNSAAAFHLRGPLQGALLEAAFNGVIERHDSLRTSFASEEGGLVQRVAASSAFRLEHAPVSRGSAEAQRAAAERFIDEAASRPFDLVAPPLRAALAPIGPNEHLLLIVMHHIITDGWSYAIFCRELSAIYTALVTGAPAALPQLPIQFADYSAWQRKWIESREADEQKAYWENKLSGGFDPLDLPLDRIRPATSTASGSECSLAIGPELASALKAMAQARGATLFMVLLAAFKTLLHRYTGQTRLTVGAPIANRQRLEAEALIGFFANTLALRTDLSGDPAFEELLNRVKETALDAYEHQDLPFELLMSGAPALAAVFGLRDFPEASLDLPGIEAERHPVSTRTAKFDLSLTVQPAGSGLSAVLEFNTEIFAPESARRMLEHWHAVLECAAVNPGRLLSEIPLSSGEQLGGIQGAPAPYPRDSCIHKVFEQQAARTPEATALVTNERQLSYGELDRRANGFAQHLRSLGCGSGALVALRAERSLEMIAGILGILKAGAVYVPLDPADPAVRWHRLVTSAGVKFLVSNGMPEGGLPAGVELIDLASTCRVECEAGPDSAAGPLDPACVFFTSGSTGEPKGAAVPHRAILRLLLGVDYVDLGAGETLLQLGPMSFDASTFELWGALLHGGRCVLFPERVPTVAMLGETLRRHGVTTLFLTTALFNLVIDEAPEILRGVRQLLTGGEALSVAHVRRAFEQLPATRLTNIYGPTEGTTFTGCHPIREIPAVDARSIPIGKPISNTTVYVLDSHLKPLPAGVPGELYIGGEGLALGYLNQPELTARKFVASPFSDTAGTRLYKSGDRVRLLPDGNIDFLGRLDDQLKIRGYRIEPLEIEAAMQTHPGIAECAVIARAEGAGGKTLAAFLVQRGEAAPAINELRSYLGSRLPNQMIPTVFVFLKALPLTPNGKIDRMALTALAPVQTEARGGYTAPSTPAEMTIAEVWQKMLGRERIGVDDEFFDLGGHSLLAVRMLARLRAAMGWDIPLARLVARPTIRELARQIDSGECMAKLPVIPLRTEGARPPMFLFYADVIPGPAFCFELRRRLGIKQPLYVVAPEEIHNYPAHPSLEATVKALLESVRRACPHGPYIIAGYCYGGVIAYEAARQLEEAGERVELLILIDSMAPNRRRIKVVRRLIERGGRLAGMSQARQRRAFSAYCTSVMRLKFLWELSARDKVAFFIRKYRERRAHRAPAETPAAGANGIGEGHAAAAPARTLEATMLTFLWELAGYSARNYSGDVALFMSEEWTDPNRGMARAWKKYAARIEEYHVPGNHGDCVTRYRDVLCESLKACLDARRA
jgi:aspartate racemase